MKQHSTSIRSKARFGAICTVILMGIASGNSLAAAPAVETLDDAAPTTTALPATAGLTGYQVQAALESAVKRFESISTTRPAKTEGTVFIGSSSFTRWKTLEKDMAQFNAINRGFGGSKTDDMLYYASRILKPLKPARVVYYCGGNDLDRKRPVDVVAGNIEAFVNLVHQEFPGVKVYYIATNYTPKRLKITDKIRAVNEAIQQWARDKTDLVYIDAMEGLIDAEGKAMPTMFMADGTHLNPDGNQIWMTNIRKAMEAEQAMSQSLK